MKSIKSIISDRFYKSKTIIMALSVLVTLPFLPLVAFALSDTTAPSVAIISPTTGSSVSGTVSVSVNATDIAIPTTDCVVTIFGTSYNVTTLQSPHPGGNIFVCGTDMTTVYLGQHGTNMSRMTPYIIPQSGISKVEFSVDGVFKSTDTVSPYRFSFDTTTVSNGTHTVSAKAFDVAGNTATSTSVLVTVNNAVPNPGTDTIIPVVTITKPTLDSIAKNKLKVKVNATDNVAVTKVEVYIDGNLVKTDNHSPYSFMLKTKKLTNGIHTLFTKAYDAVGNVGLSSTINFTVNHKVKIEKENEKKDWAHEKNENKPSKNNGSDRENDD